MIHKSYEQYILFLIQNLQTYARFINISNYHRLMSNSQTYAARIDICSSHKLIRKLPETYAGFIDVQNSHGLVKAHSVMQNTHRPMQGVITLCTHRNYHQNNRISKELYQIHTISIQTCTRYLQSPHESIFTLLARLI